MRTTPRQRTTLYKHTSESKYPSASRRNDAEQRLLEVMIANAMATFKCPDRELVPASSFRDRYGTDPSPLELEPVTRKRQA